MNRSTWNVTQHYAAVLNVIATILAPSMRVLFASATYHCSCSLMYICVAC